MLSRKEALLYIIKKHGKSAIYIAPTGFLSRAMYELFPEKENVFYMQRDVVVINGDASHIMHLGLTHTIRDYAKENLSVYILDNGCHESVGGQPCSQLEESYVGVTEIIKISKDGKTP